MIGIELVEGCNFKCYFCRASSVSKNTYMDADLYKRIILEAEQLGITSVKLTPEFGEPFLHPDIYELLDHSCKHMKHTHMFTNATAINVDKLKNICRHGLELNISWYGDTPEKFIELTHTNEHLFRVFHDKLHQLSEAGIQHTIYRRDVNYVFDYAGGEPLNTPPFDKSVKCPFHQNPKIMASGDITFCSLIRPEIPNNKDIFYANLHQMSLKDAVEHPIRFKFFNTQSICAARCTSFDRPCHHEHTLASLRFMGASRRNYRAAEQTTDAAYADMEAALGVTNEYVS